MIQGSILKEGMAILNVYIKISYYSCVSVYPANSCGFFPYEISLLLDA